MEGDYNVLVLELLGPTLQDLFTYCKRRFPVRTVVQTARQMVARLRYLHEKQYLHRDLKPENFVIGVGAKEGVVHLIDYGLAKRFIVRDTGEHVPFKDHKKFVGVARYASLHAHQGLEQGRRDDLESVGHILLYLLKGALPWQGVVVAKDGELEQAIYHKKALVSIAELCQDVPGTLRSRPLDEFAQYMNYCRGLEFAQLPDYAYLDGLFLALQGKLDEPSASLSIDWTSLKQVLRVFQLQQEKAKKKPRFAHFKPAPELKARGVPPPTGCVLLA